MRTGYVRKVARKVLKDMNISKAPIDIISIIESRGYIYREVSGFPKELDALFIRQNDQMYAAVNKNHHPHRKRFSLAHELGHILLHQKSILDLLPEVSIDSPPLDGSLEQVAKDIENEANEFAGEILVPLSILKKEMQKGQEMPELAKLFNVSQSAMTIRIMNNRGSLFR